MTHRSVNEGGGSGQTTSSSLLERVKSQDPQAWTRIVHLLSPLVYRWCRQDGLQEADAADVGQEVFRAIFGAIGGFQHDREGSLRGWVRIITRNKIRDFWRHAKTREELGAGGSDAYRKLQQIAAKEDCPEDESSIQDDNRLMYRRALEMILATCAEHTRQAFMRTVIEKQPVAIVALELGISANSVRLAKSRILRRICEEFAGLVEM